MKETQWLLCPICNKKTRIKVREDTELKNFPLYCPKCKKESLIEKLLNNASSVDDYINNIYLFLSDYNERYNKTILESEILDLCTNNNS